MHSRRLRLSRWMPLVFAGLLVLQANPCWAGGNGLPSYPGGPTSYEPVGVPNRFDHLIGVWEGPFRAYDRDAKVFRPYRNRLTFTRKACYRVTGGGPGDGDILLVGTLSDDYPEFRTPAGAVLPAKHETGFLIYGLKRGDPNRVFVRSVEEGSGTLEYEPEYALPAAQAFVYRAVISAHGDTPQLIFRILSEQDPTADDDSRIFALALTVGPVDHPSWEGIIVGGKQQHSTSGLATGPTGTALAPTSAPSPPAGRKGAAGTKPGTMDVHRAMDAVIKDDKARRAARGLMTTLPRDY